MTEKSGYKHFMLKEIFQETMVIRNNLEDRINLSTKTLELKDLSLPLDKIKKIERIYILACGSSYYTALAGKYIFEELTGIPVEVDYSSEFRYRKILLGKKDLVILISQSGETADTIAALKACREAGSYILALTNVKGSTISREADSVMYIKAGPEIGVATTKAFVGQLMCLYILSLYFAQIREILDSSEINKIISGLIKIPQMVEIILLKDPEIIKISEEFCEYHNFLYLGRGINYPIALEGALKLKEISYIHAEGYPAGEMKHGPIALLDKTFPVVVIVPRDKVYTKVINNIKEVKARDTLVLAIATEGDKEIINIVDKVFYIPKTSDIL
jgi:glucosamine--fructose-6-phosphate aminotransferase (isomerizing)